MSLHDYLHREDIEDSTEKITAELEFDLHPSKARDIKSGVQELLDAQILR